MKILRTICALFIAFSALGQAYPAAAALDTWTAIGPGLGSVFTIAVDPLEADILYAGTVGGGVYKSTNAGQDWSPANTGLTDAIVYALAIDPGSPDTVFAGTRGSNNLSGRVFKSTDAGGSWADTGLSGSRYINALAIDPQAPGTVYAGTYGTGVFKTTNRGDNWAATGLTDAFVYALAIDPTTQGTLYAGTLSGLYQSKNAGDTWDLVFADPTYVGVHAVAVDPQNPLVLYAGTAYPNGSNGPGGIFKSPDGGKTWNPVLASLTGPYVRSLVIDPSNPETVYAGTGDPVNTTGSAHIYQTTNGGTEWNAVWSGPNNNTVLILAIDPADSQTLYAGIRRYGMIKSINRGQNWSEANSGLNNTYIYALTINPTDPRTLYAGTWNGILKTTNLGGNWSLVFKGSTDIDIQALAIDPQAPDTLYAGIGNPSAASILGGVQKSTNGGDDWSPSGLNGIAVNALLIDPTTPSVIYAGTGSGLYKSEDSGGSWKSILCCNPVAAVAIDPTAAGTVYAGTLGAGVFKRDHGGDNWAAANVGLGDTSYVNALAIDPTAPVTLYAATGDRTTPSSPGGVFKSTDQAASWTPAGLTTTRVYSLAISPGAPAILFAGTSDNGVAMSQTGGADWQEMDSGMPLFGSFIPINALATDPDSGDILYAGTDGSGSFAAQVRDATPTLASLNPNTLEVGGADFTLTVTGTNFIKGAVVKWGSSDLATTFISPTQLSAAVPGANLGAAGMVQITVANPVPGGSISNAQGLTIQASLTITPESGGQMQFIDLQGNLMKASAPAGAVTQTVTLVWIPQNGLVHGATALPKNYAYAGKAFILQVWIGGVLQDSFTFKTPLTLSLQYRPGDLGSIFEHMLRLYYWDAAHHAWKDAACGQGYSRDPANHLVSVQVCHASEFGLLGSTFEQKTFLPVTIH